MTWQDIVLSVGSWIFVIALLPSIFGKDKPPLVTSLMTGTILVIYAFTYSTLHLWLSVASTGAVGLAWFTLAVQKVIAKSRQVTQPQNPS